MGKITPDSELNVNTLKKAKEEGYSKILFDLELIETSRLIIKKAFNKGLKAARSGIGFKSMTTIVCILSVPIGTVAASLAMCVAYVIFIYKNHRLVSIKLKILNLVLNYLNFI